MINRILNAILWTAPYLIAGFSAPVIFKMAATPRIGGHYAGILFIFSGLWALFLAFSHGFALPLKIYFVGFVTLELIFWGSRFREYSPLNETILLGMRGGVWHGVLTGLYLVGALGLLISAYKRNS